MDVGPVAAAGPGSATNFDVGRRNGHSVGRLQVNISFETCFRRIWEKRWRITGSTLRRYGRRTCTSMHFDCGGQVHVGMLSAWCCGSYMAILDGFHGTGNECFGWMTGSLAVAANGWYSNRTD